MLSAASVNVPANFAGMQILKGVRPAGFTSPWARNWDQSNATNGPAAVVRNISTGLGTFDWSRFDLFMSNNAACTNMVFTLGQVADWIITRSARGGASAGVSRDAGGD